MRFKDFAEFKAVCRRMAKRGDEVSFMDYGNFWTAIFASGKNEKPYQGISYYAEKAVAYAGLGAIGANGIHSQQELQKVLEVSRCWNVGAN